MPISLVDVATKAEVSVGTASRVLTRTHGARISAATKERVLQAANELGYRPNAFARRLQGKQTMTIGFMVAGLQNPFFVSMARELELAAAVNGYQISLDCTLLGQWGYRQHEPSCSWPVDGVFIWSNSNKDLEKFLGSLAKNVPIVYLGRQGGGEHDNVAFDLTSGGRQIAEHALSRGYRKATCVVPEILPSADDRLLAIHEVLKNGGASVETIRFGASPTLRTGALATGLAIGQSAYEQRPEIVVCTDDITAIGIYNGLRRAGLRVPEDIAITGFDGIEDAFCLDKPMTTVRCSTDSMAHEAVALMLSRLTGEYSGAARTVTVPTQLQVGETSGELKRVSFRKDLA